jgi:hypothetical protein
MRATFFVIAVTLAGCWVPMNVSTKCREYMRECARSCRRSADPNHATRCEKDCYEKFHPGSHVCD